MVCLGRPYHFRFFTGYLPQILLGPFLNTLTHMFVTREYQMIGQIFAPGIKKYAEGMGHYFIILPCKKSFPPEHITVNWRKGVTFPC